MINNLWQLQQIGNTIFHKKSDFKYIIKLTTENALSALVSGTPRLEFCPGCNSSVEGTDWMTADDFSAKTRGVRNPFKGEKLTSVHICLNIQTYINCIKMIFYTINVSLQCKIQTHSKCIFHLYNIRSITVNLYPFIYTQYTNSIHAHSKQSKLDKYVHFN